MEPKTTPPPKKNTRASRPLSEITVRNAKPGIKLYRIKDDRGLYLEVTPNGSKLWRFRFRFGGKENMLSLGPYPDVSLKEARVRRDDARKLLVHGQDPSAARKDEKALLLRDSNTFEVIAREWFIKFKSKWASSHASKIIRRLELYVFPWLGNKAIHSISSQDIISVIQRIEQRGIIETAHRSLQTCNQIFRYALAKGVIDRNPAFDLHGFLPPSLEKHRATITDPKAVGELIRAIDSYKGGFVVACALKLAPLVFVRPGELRHAEWAEIDFKAQEWRIPASKMKMKDQHIVPLSTQGQGLLREIQPLTGSGRYVFPSERTADRPMSDAALIAALRRLGYAKEEMSVHGFRAMASTLLHELGWNRDAIERQLAHAERNKVRAAYNYAEFLPERREMMQAWADHLEALKL